MSEHTNETLAKDIRDLAAMLLAHPETGPVIRDAGVRRNFTEAAKELVMGIAKDSPMLEMFARYWEEMPYQCNAGDWCWNAIVASGLARQIADGLIDSIDAPEAVDLIKRNEIPIRVRNEIGKGRSTIPISFKLFHKILAAFPGHPDFERLRDEWRYDEDRDPNHRKHAAFCEPARQHQYRYGEINQMGYGSVASSLLNKNIDINDQNAVWDHINSFPVPIGPQFIDDRSAL